MKAFIIAAYGRWGNGNGGDQDLKELDDATSSGSDKCFGGCRTNEFS